MAVPKKKRGACVRAKTRKGMGKMAARKACGVSLAGLGLFGRKRRRRRRSRR